MVSKGSLRPKRIISLQGIMPK